MRADALLHLHYALSAAEKAKDELARAIETVGDGDEQRSLGFVNMRADQLAKSIAQSLTHLTRRHRG